MMKDAPVKQTTGRQRPFVARSIASVAAFTLTALSMRGATA